MENYHSSLLTKCTDYDLAHEKWRFIQSTNPWLCWKI